MRNNRRGFTVLELLITIIIMGIIFIVVGNVFFVSIRANRVANAEFDLQSNMRTVSESLNQSIKFSPAVFTLKKETFEKDKKPGWRYFGIEETKNESGNLTGKKEIVEYIPIIEKEEFIDGETVITFKTEEPTHTKKILLDEPEDINFNLYFSKDVSSSNGKLLEFVIEGIQDNNLQRKMTVKTQLQALNAMTVEHEGNPAVGIAYKEEVPGKRVKGTQEAYAIITLVLDKSGSMSDRDINDNGVRKTRIQVLNEKTNKLINDLKDAGDKIYISVIPYDTRVDGHDKVLPNFQHIKDTSTVSLTAGGWTNTGEALLKSYHMLTNKPGITIPTGAKVNYYNILLTDGFPNYYVEYGLTNNHLVSQGSIRNSQSFIISSSNGMTDYFFRDSWNNLSYSHNGRTYNVPYSNQQDRNGWGFYSMPYVKAIGKNFISQSPLEIKSYVIGFGPGMDANSREIASYCVGLNSPSNNPLNKDGSKAYYSATSADELDIVYSELTEIIKGDMWHVMGPY